MSRCDECRRRFLRTTVTGITALLAPGCGDVGRSSAATDAADPREGDDAAPGNDGGGGPEEMTEAGSCQPACPAGAKILALPFSEYPQLKNVGGSAVTHAPGYSDPSCHLDLIIVAQPSAGTYVAFSASCPHQCCTVSFNQAQLELVCPCHGSTFNLSGAVIGGPAPNGLQLLTVCADECAVSVSLP